MDPVSLGLAAKVAGPVFSGFQALQQGKAEQDQAEINSFIGRTRALQTDTTSRQGLEDELGTMRAALGANSQSPGVGTLEVARDLRQVRNRERRINVGARMAEAHDFRRQGQMARSRGMGGFIGGAIQAGPSMFDLYQYRSR